MIIKEMLHPKLGPLIYGASASEQFSGPGVFMYTVVRLSLGSLSVVTQGQVCVTILNGKFQEPLDSLK